MKAKRREEDTVAGPRPVFLYHCNLDVNTAAVKELMHGPYTSWLCEMNFDPAVSLLAVRKPSLAWENEFPQSGIACHSEGTGFVCEAIASVGRASLSNHT